MERRVLGGSGVHVSALALGSWRTWERIPRERAVASMQAARELGICFLDDARYDDETGQAPIPTGYSEVVFGELFRAAGWKRDEVVIANKLWWEFWPEQAAAEELDASLRRMGLDRLDLVYAERLPDGLPVESAVHDIVGLVEAGKARVWGVLNWSPASIADAVEVAARAGLAGPCAAQLPYSLAQTSVVESEPMEAALDAAGASVVASAVLANGTLTGKYSVRDAPGRLAEQRDDPRRRPAFELGERLRVLARELDATPAQLAIAFALTNRRVASVLFGATSPEQVVENVGALELVSRMGDDERTALRALVEGEALGGTD